MNMETTVLHPAIVVIATLGGTAVALAAIGVLLRSVWRFARRLVHLVDLVRWTCGSEFARIAAQAGIAYPFKPVAGSGPSPMSSPICQRIARPRRASSRPRSSPVRG